LSFMMREKLVNHRLLHIFKLIRLYRGLAVFNHSKNIKYFKHYF